MPRSDPSYPNVSDDEMFEGMRDGRGPRRPRPHPRRERRAAARQHRAAARGRGGRDMLAHHESRPPFVKEEAVHRALFLAAHAGVPGPDRAHLDPGQRRPRHRRAGRRRRRVGRGLPAPLDPRPRRRRPPRPARLLRAPPVRERAVSRAVEAPGRRHRLPGSDHSAYTLEEKALGEADIFACPLGCGSSRRRCRSSSRRPCTAAGWRSTRSPASARRTPARILGLYPHKGTIRPGADPPRDLGPRREVDGETAAAVLEEPVVDRSRRAHGARARRADARARRDGLPRRRDLGRAGPWAVPVLAGRPVPVPTAGTA